MDSYAAVNARRHLTRHTISDDFSYALDRLVCSCGEVMRAQGAVDWPAHKRAVGEPVSYSAILGPSKGRKALRVAAA